MSKRFARTITILFTAALVVLATSSNLTAADKTAKASLAPDWELQTTDGKTAKLSDYRGKVVILDFWDTWCPPCKKEIPGFIELQDQYGKEGLVVIGAAFGRYGMDAVKTFVKEWKINYPVVLADKATNDSYGGIRSIPTTFVINREGKIISKHVGFVEKNVFEKEIKALL